MPGRNTTQHCKKLAGTLRAIRADLTRDAAATTSNQEIIHRLRIHSRRAQAMMRWFRTRPPPAGFRKLVKFLKEVRRNAGALRDADTILKYLHEPRRSPLRAPHALLIGLAVANRHFHEVQWRKLLPGILSRSERLETRLNQAVDRENLRIVRNKDRRRLLSEGLLQIQRDCTTKPSPSTLHPLRLSVKKARYTLESLPGQLPAWKPWLMWLKTIQLHLGSLHDRQVFKNWLQSLEAIDLVDDFIPGAAWKTFLRARQLGLAKEIQKQLREIQKQLQRIPEIPAPD